MGLFNKKEKSNKNGGFNFDEGKESKLPDLFRTREISKKSGNERSVIRKSDSFDLDKLTSDLNIDDIETLSEADLADLNGDVSAKLDEVIKEYSNGPIDIMFVFDKSSSCFGTERDMINGYNEFIKSERQKGNNDFITTVLFDQAETVLCDRTPVIDVKGLEYFAFGGTALYDCLCHELKRLDSKKKNNTKTIVFIMTDGEDNSSRLHNINDTRRIISKLRNGGWQFIFLGAMDFAKDYAVNLGIDEEYAETYNPNAVQSNFKAIEKVVDDIHVVGKISDDWSEPVVKARLQIEGRKHINVKKIGKRK